MPLTTHPMSKTRLAHCLHCNDTRHFRKRSLDHLMQLAATVFTFGLWSVAWLGVTIQHFRKPWRCSYCGNRMPRQEPAQPVGRTGVAVAREAAVQR